jgi:geranylgeranyl diphosphate synthase type II
MSLYTVDIESSLRQAVGSMGVKSSLRDACEYALLSGGKRLRPRLVLAIAESLGQGLDVTPAALSAEFFHTASLIADDLPCMDDDDFRRNLPSTHKVFGESTALLASYTLIAEGYRGIYENGLRLEEVPRFSFDAKERTVLALKAASLSGGLKGATYGQFLDLSNVKMDWEIVETIIMQKTVSLFEICLLFGWIFGGGSLDAEGDLKMCARHLGIAFQIADDLQDLEQKKGMNAALVLGKKRAESLLIQETALLKDSLRKLGLWNPLLCELLSVH